MSFGEWIVESFHINVAVGDCAIHLLVQENYKAKPPLKAKTIWNAVLIDGGSKSKNRLLEGTILFESDAISPMVDWIQNSGDYGYANGADHLTFNSIVISHWDEDHYGGLVKGLATILATKPNPSPPFTRQVPWLKYNATTGVPETVLYCPNIDVIEVSPYLNGVPKQLHYEPTDGLIYVKSNTDYFRFAVFRTARTTTGDDVTNIRCVLGVNFFNNQALPATATGVTPATLLTLNNPGGPAPGCPGMYCIGVLKQSLTALGTASTSTSSERDESTASTSKNTTSIASDTIGASAGNLNPDDPEIVPEHPTETNKVSIATAIIWPQQGNAAPRCSHYFAGDADEASEQNFLAWMRSGTVPISRLTSMKISHHGARSSTPTQFLDQMTPTNLIISTPNGRYFHPSWEFLICAALYSRKSAFSGTANTLVPAIFAPKYPFYFTQGTNGKYNVENKVMYNTKNFDHPDLSNTGFIQWMKTKYNSLMVASAPRSLVTDYVAYTTYDKPRPRFLDSLRAYWHSYCWPDASRLPSATYSTVGALMANNPSFVQCLIVVSRNNDADGNVYYKSYTSPSRKQCRTRVLETGPHLTGSKRTPPAELKDDEDPGTVPIKRSRPALDPDDMVDADVLSGPLTFALPAWDPNPPPTSPPPPEQPEIPWKPGDLGVNRNEQDPNIFKEPDTPVQDQELDHPVLKTSLGTKVKLAVRPDSDPPPPPTTLANYYICASTINPSQWTQNFANLPVDNDWEWFVRTLHTSVIALQQDPNKAPVPQTIPLDPTDELACWLTDAVNAVPNTVTMLNSGPSSPNCGINGFQFYMDLPTTVEQGPIPVLFSSDNDALNQTFNNTDTPPLGMRDGGTALVFALVAQQTESTLVSLSDLATFVGIGDMFQTQPFLEALGLLSFTVPQTPDKLLGERNALWFIPQLSYRTVLRLQFDMNPNEVTALNNIFQDLGDFKMENPYVIARMDCLWRSSTTSIQTVTNGQVVVQSDFSFVSPLNNDKINLTAGIEIDEGAVVLTLTLDKSTTPKPSDDSPTILDSFLSWICSGLLKGIVGVDFFDFTTYLDNITQFFTFGTEFRRVRFEFCQDQSDLTSKKLKFASFDLDLQMSLGLTSGGDNVYFLVTYTYTSIPGQTVGQGSTLQADLWTAPPLDPTSPRLALLPDYESYDFLEPLDENYKNWPKFVDLSEIKDFDDMPNIIPPALTAARLFVSSQGMSFSGTLVAKPMQTAKSVPPQIDVYQIDLNALYRFHPTAGQSRFAVSADISVLIQPPPNSKWSDMGPAEIVGEIAYDSSAWSMSLSVERLFGAYLFQFFDSSLQGAAATLLGDIEIANLNVTYSYSSKQPSILSFTASLMIGDFELDLLYNHNGDKWVFSADASFETNQDVQTNLGAILSYLTGMTTEEMDLPECVSNVTISLKTANDHIGVFLLPNAHNSCVLFTVYLVLDNVSIQYVNFEYTALSPNQQGTNKRVFLSSIAPMDEQRLPDVPLVGTIPQPFDELLFMWVQPQKGYDGLTLAEIGLLNEALAQIQAETQVPMQPIPFQSVSKDTKPTDIVVVNDNHLILVLRDLKGVPHVVLDYRFGAQSAEPPPGPSAKTGALVPRDDDPSPANPDGSGMAPYSKSFGPLQVRNLGLKFSTTILSIRVDASITIGPLAFDLYGFTLTLDFSSSSSWSLSNLPRPFVSIDGLAAEYDEPPVDIAGIIEYIRDEDMYEGGLTVSYDPWLFTAAGCYGKVQDFKTAFVYCSLDGPLITLEFAEISGITGGFGYNSDLKLPVATDVPNFPLIQVPAGASGSPQNAQSSLFQTIWFKPRDGARWIAVGLTVTAFEMLDLSAVVVIECEPSVKLGIYAIATMDIPKGDDYPFAQVQLAMAATLDVGAGTLKIDGQLTPASYILDPMCHLTGGYAFYSWFAPADAQANDPDAALRGDWVFTLGGYHRAFTAPPQFPQPPRLGIAWDLGVTALRGDAYFAITPGVCMGGGRWDVSMDVGPLSAWYEFWADFLISFKPFHFIADGGVDVGVAFTLDLWIVTIHISVDINANIHVEGPSIHGTVHVDFWVFGFDVDFGEDNDDFQALTLDQFLDLACQQRLQSSPSKLVTGTSVTARDMKPKPAADTEQEVETYPKQAQDGPPRVMHVLTVEEGLIPTGSTNSTPSGGLWKVRSAPFTFRVATKVPALSASVRTIAADGKTVVSENPVPGTANPIHARPMCQPGLTLQSFLIVNIQPNAPSARRRAALDDSSEPRWTVANPINKDLPMGLWGDYSATSDPSYHANDPTLLDGTQKTTKSFLCGLTISQPLPAPSADKLAMFDYRRFMVEEIPCSDDFPALTKQQTPFLPLEPDDGGGSVHSTQWHDVYDAWTAPGQGANAASLTAQVWQLLGVNLLGWDTKKVDGTNGPPLSGKLPGELVGDLTDYYMWAPMLSGKLDYDN